ncbi:MAG: sigma-70 family RNA polymerase sigma factor, partial [Candidatus Latescibacterota bacterium]
MAERDRLLIERTLAGDRNAFGHLVERYTPLVRGVIWEALRRPDEVEDLAQEVFTRAYEQLSRLRRFDRFPGWLCRIATNAVIDHQRRRQQREAEAATRNPRSALHLRRPDEVLEEDEATRLLWEALDHLEPVSRQIVVLHYFEQCSQRQIARFLDRSLPMVKWRLFEAKIRLHDELFEKLGREAQTRFASRRQLRDKVIAVLPVPLLLHPRPGRWMASRMRRGAWLLGTATALGVGGVAYLAWQDRTDEVSLVSREALRQQQAAVQGEPWVTWTPLQPRPGQMVRLTAAGLTGTESEPPVLHYLTDPWYPVDHVVPMHREDTLWVARLTVPAAAVALFLYPGPPGEGPYPLNQRAYLTTRRYLDRYRQVLLVHDDAGRPLPGAIHAEARMAKRLDHPAEEVLAYTDRELALHPDYLQAYADRWTALLELGRRSPAALAQVRSEQEALQGRYPDRPEVLWWSAQVPTGWQDSLFRELSRRYPQFEKADDAAFRITQGYPHESRVPAATASLAEFVRAFPDSRYLDEAYRLWLAELSRTAPDQAAKLADDLIERSQAVPSRSAAESGQSISISTPGGSLPEAYAYSLRFALLLREGKVTEALGLARRLIASGLRDPGPYLHLGQRLAGEKVAPVIPGDSSACPNDLGLAIQVLEAALPWATPEHLLQLPGYSTYFDMPAHVRTEMRQFYLDQALGQRQSLLLALARCHQTRGDDRAAGRCLEESAAVRSRILASPLQDDPTFFLLGQTNERLGRWEAAERAYLQAVAQDFSHRGAEAGLRRLHRQRYGHLKLLAPLLQTCYPQAPEFALQDSLGRSVKRSDYRGKVLLLWYDSFEETPVPTLERLKAWAEAHREAGLEVLHLRRSPEPRPSPLRLALDDD